MASSISCRLCSFTCREYKCLYDGDGQKSEVYRIAAKYFNPTLLDAETEPTLRVICPVCWQHISDFHSFQQWILNAQALQDDFNFIINDENSSKEMKASNITDLNIDTAKINSNYSNALVVVDDKENDVFFSDIKGQLQCEICKEICKNCVALRAHTEQFHNVINAEETLSTKTKSSEFDDNEQTSKKNNDENSFKCETCRASFSQYGSLRRHIRKKHTVHPLLKWICKYCNKMFKNRSHLERHKNKLHNCYYNNHLETDTTPSAAKQNFDDEENYKVYSKTEKVKMCKGKIFNHSNTDSALDLISIETSKIKNGQQSYKKNCYNTRFSAKEISVYKNINLDSDIEPSSSQVNANTQIHMPALEIVDIKSEISTDTDTDGDTMQDKTNMNSNEVNSDIEEDYDDFLAKWTGDWQCPRCNQHVKCYSQLTEHFLTEHPEERCYIICCHTTLYGRQSIAEHLQYHANPNAFKCPDCGKCFKNKRGLFSHKLQVHRDHRSSYHLHLCYCKRDKQLPVKNTPDRHLMEYDTLVCCQRKKKILEDDALIAKWKKELTCEICKSSFSYFSLKRIHFYREHPGEKCYIFCCQRKMSRISDALQHIRFHLDPHAYRCKVCHLDFSGKNTLAKHMRNVHLDCVPKYRYACDECDKTFEIRQILTRHKNVHHSKNG